MLVLDLMSHLDLVPLSYYIPTLMIYTAPHMLSQFAVLFLLRIGLWRARFTFHPCGTCTESQITYLQYPHEPRFYITDL